MEYIKTTCTISPDREIHREILIAELGAIGYESFVEQEHCVEAYIRKSDYSPLDLEDLFPNDFSLFQPSFVSEIIPDQNWNEEWEKNYFEPLLVAERCLIRAPFHTNYPQGEIEIIIEPAMAFGTGNHETTSLMITSILELALEGKKVLDMGCGTGILSILAYKQGAELAKAIDIDQWAVDSTNLNAQYNDIPNLQARLGDVKSIPDIRFDVIFANIQRNVILQDLPEYVKALKPEGELIVSGFYKHDLEMILKRAEEYNLSLERVLEQNDWVVARLKRSQHV